MRATPRYRGAPSHPVHRHISSALNRPLFLSLRRPSQASLRHAMKKGVFHKRLGNTSVAVDLCAIVQVLIEVAQAIQHLHSLKLIHCDIKVRGSMYTERQSACIAVLRLLHVVLRE